MIRMVFGSNCWPRIMVFPETDGTLKMSHIKLRLCGRVSSLPKRDSWRILVIELDQVRWFFFFGTTHGLGTGRWHGNSLIYPSML